MTMSIAFSVGEINGKPCTNRVEDQKTVMALLDKIPETLGGTMMPGGSGFNWPAPFKGRAARELVKAIYEFQKINRGRGLAVDGHVDPGYRTIAVLNELAGLGLGSGDDENLDRMEATREHNIWIRVEGIDITNDFSSPQFGSVHYRYVTAGFDQTIRQILSPSSGPFKGHGFGTLLHFQTEMPARARDFEGNFIITSSARPPDQFWPNVTFVASLQLILQCATPDGRIASVHLTMNSFTKFEDLRGPRFGRIMATATDIPVRLAPGRPPMGVERR